VFLVQVPNMIENLRRAPLPWPTLHRRIKPSLRAEEVCLSLCDVRFLEEGQLHPDVDATVRRDGARMVVLGVPSTPAASRVAHCPTVSAGIGRRRIRFRRGAMRMSTQTHRGPGSAWGAADSRPTPAPL
jgi:hypothetical protein